MAGTEEQGRAIAGPELDVIMFWRVSLPDRDRLRSLRLFPCGGCLAQRVQSLVTQTKRMIKVNILYPNNEGAWFDLDYYCNVHMPMSIRMLSPALKGVSVESGLSVTTPGSKPTY